MEVDVGGGEVALVPVVDELVDEVRLEDGLVAVTLPEGMIEITRSTKREDRVIIRGYLPVGKD